MSFLCGVFVPQFMLAQSVIHISKFLPAYWYIKANTMLAGMYNTSLKMSSYWNCILIQLLFAAAMFAAYLVLKKMKRQSK